MPLVGTRVITCSVIDTRPITASGSSSTHVDARSASNGRMSLTNMLDP